MAEVEVIKAVEGPILRKRDYEGKPLVITRQRVAAYVRVSTDDEEQLESFQSQKKYYQEKISENRDWVMVGIYADEAITGTKVDKREQFQRMIQDCMDGKIDVYDQIRVPIFQKYSGYSSICASFKGKRHCGDF